MSSFPDFRTVPDKMFRSIDSLLNSLKIGHFRRTSDFIGQSIIIHHLIIYSSLKWSCDQKWPVGCISDENLSILKVRIRSMRKRKAEIISFSLILIFRIIRFGWSSAQTIISLKTPLPLFKCKCIHTNNNCTPLRIHFYQSWDPREPRFWFVVCSNQNEEYILNRKKQYFKQKIKKLFPRYEHGVEVWMLVSLKTNLWSARINVVSWKWYFIRVIYTVYLSHI